MAYTAWDPGAPAGAWALPTYNRGGRLSPDGRRIASVDGHELVLRDADTGAEARRIPLLPRDLIWWDANGVCAVGWSGDGRTAGVVLPRGMVVVVEIDAGRVRTRFKVVMDSNELPPPNRWQNWWVGGDPAVRLSPDGRWAAVVADGQVALWETATGRRAAGFDANAWAAPFAAQFHPDGRSVVLSYHGYAERVDLPRFFARDPAGPPAKLWDEATGTGAADAEAATRAAFALFASADGRKLVREKLPPAKPDPAAEARVKGWVADLGSDDFKTRESASKALAGAGRGFDPLLQQARAATTSPEVQRRLDVALAAGPTPDDTRVLRLVHAAELCDAADARELLAAWAGGAAGAALTDEAKAALARLGKT